MGKRLTNELSLSAAPWGRGGKGGIKVVHDSCGQVINHQFAMENPPVKSYGFQVSFYENGGFPRKMDGFQAGFTGG